MQVIKLLSLLFLHCLSALGQSGSNPPNGALVVSKTPDQGQFDTIQAAIYALSNTTTSLQSLWIAAGTYYEQVYIPPLLSQTSLSIYGETADTSTYTSNTVTIVQGLSQNNVSSNDLTATVRAWNPNTAFYNLNFVNNRGPGSQALAISAQATQQGYYACNFTGYQDTILANEGNQVYAKSYIQGATDFIFGQRARAWFEQCDIRVSTPQGVGYVTANGRDSDTNPSYYVINNSTVDAANGQPVAPGTYYLGRPWRNYARVVFQNTVLSDVINYAGWSIWNVGDERTNETYFGEFDNTGPGANGPRAAFEKSLTEAVNIAEILGNSWQDWVDTAYVSA